MFPDNLAQVVTGRWSQAGCITPLFLCVRFELIFWICNQLSASPPPALRQSSASPPTVLSQSSDSPQARRTMSYWPVFEEAPPGQGLGQLLCPDRTTTQIKASLETGLHATRCSFATVAHNEISFTAMMDSYRVGGTVCIQETAQHDQATADGSCASKDGQLKESGVFLTFRRSHGDRHACEKLFNQIAVLSGVASSTATPPLLTVRRTCMCPARREETAKAIVTDHISLDANPSYLALEVRVLRVLRVLRVVRVLRVLLCMMLCMMLG